MSKRTRRLLAENNALDDQLSAEGSAVMTDIVCYLRAADITPYQQELLRRDITQMLLDGERRGESAQAVIGGDFRTFCDDVLSETPRRTALQRLLSGCGVACLCLGMLSALWFVMQLIACAAGKAAWPWLPVSAGAVVSALAITLLSWGIVQAICRNTFEHHFLEGKAPFVLLFIALFAIMAAGIFLRAELFTVHAGAALVFIAALFLLSRIADHFE